jgi:hypothetical protein
MKSCDPFTSVRFCLINLVPQQLLYALSEFDITCLTILVCIYSVINSLKKIPKKLEFLLHDKEGNGTLF